MPGLLESLGISPSQEGEPASTAQAAPEQRPPQMPTFLDALQKPELMHGYSQMTSAQIASSGETPGVLRAVAGRLPWIRHAFDVGDALMTSGSRQRIAANQGTEQDFSRVASADRFRQIQAERTAGENLGEGLMDIPATLAEFGVAGRAVQALGLAAAPAAGATLGARAAAFTGQTAATTALTGSWASRWVHNNESQGRTPLDWRGFPSAFGHEMATVAVLGSLGHFGDTIGANNVGGFLARGLARVGIGMGEQGALDVATSAIQNSVQNVFNHDLGLDAGYGLVGQVVRGERDAALANATQQALTFAVFAGIHEAGRTPVMREYSAALRGLRLEGVPAAEAGRRMESVTSLMQGALQSELTRSEARMLLESSPAEGAARRYGESLLKTIPEAPRASRALLEPLTRRQESLSDFAGPEAERLGPPRQGEVAPPTGKSASSTPPVEAQVHPVQALAERKAKIDAALRDVTQKIDDKTKKSGAKNSPDHPSYDPLLAEQKSLKAQSEALRLELHAEMAKNRPAKASEPPKGPSEPPKPPAKPETRPEIPRPRTEPTQMPGFMRPKPEAPVARPKNAWNNTGTRFREAGEGLQFTGRNGQNYQMTEHFIQPGERPSSPHGGVILRVHDENGREVAHVGLFRNKEGHWQGEGLHVDKSARDSKDRRTGVASAMYDYIASQGGHVLPSEGQTPEGKRFWERNRMMAEKPPELPRPRSEPTQQPGFMRPGNALREKMTEAKLTPIERHVIEQLHGQFRDVAPTHEAIGSHPETMRIGESDSGHKGAYTRAGIQAIEKRALEKMGTTVAEASAQSQREQAKIDRADLAGETTKAVHDNVRKLEEDIASGKIDPKEAKKRYRDIGYQVDELANKLSLRVIKALEKARAEGASAEDVALLKQKFQKENERVQQVVARGREAVRSFTQTWQPPTKAQKLRPAKGPGEPAAPAVSEPATPSPGEPAARPAEPAASAAGPTTPANPQLARMPLDKLQAMADKGRGPKAVVEELARRQALPEFGKPITEAERSVLPGGGQPNAGEKPVVPLQTAAIANESIDAWRDKQGLTPILRDARQADPAVWDAAMARLSADPNAASRVVDDILSKPRSTTAEENALLLQRTVAVRNERQRNMIDLVDAYNQRTREGGKQKASPETIARIAELENVERDLAEQVDKVDKASRVSGSEWGRAGRWRRILVAEDFSLAGMLRSAEAAAGRPLTETERVEITDLNQKIAELQKKLDEAEATGKVKPGSASDEGFAVDQVHKTFERKVTRLKDANAPWEVKALRAAGESVNVPRAIMTSIDFPLLRQGQLVAASHPSIAMKAIPEMLKAFQNDAVADRALYNIRHDPDFKFSERVGLEITDRNAPITAREEGFLSRFMHAENIAELKRTNPKLGVIAQALTLAPRSSERAYQTVMNRLRFDMFKMMTEKLSRNGAVTDSEGRVIANYINVMTGRGPLGAKGEKAAQWLSQVFFAPRWTMSRFQYVLGQPLFRNIGESAPRARLLVAKEYARTLSGIGVALAAAAAAGLAVVTDPRSSAFGQVQAGNTFLDFTGGLRRPTTLLSQLWSGKRVDSYGVPMPIRGDVPHGQPNASDQIWRYVRSSLAPIPGASINLAAGSDLGGKPTTAAGEAANMVSPLFIRDVVGAMKDLDVPQGTTASLLALMGMSMQTRDTQPRPQTTLTPASQREHILRGQIQSLENMMRGNRLSGGQMIRGTPPNAETRARIQRQIDMLVRQLP